MIKYSLRRNKLTKPESFRPIVNITSVLGVSELSFLIKQKVPTLVQGEIEKTLITFKDVALEQLLDGNAINMINFFSIRPAFKPGKVDGHLDLIPSCSKCKAKVTVSKNMIQDSSLKATFSFSGDTTEGKTSTRTTIPGTGSTDSCGVPIPGEPEVNVTSEAKIIEVKSMPYGIQDHVHNNSGLVITGENMVFDPDIIDSGVWLISQNNTSRLQENVLSVKPKSVMVVGDVDFEGGQAGTNSVEHRMRLARINSKGIQKDTFYSRFVRKTNIVTQDNNQLMVTSDQTEGPLSVYKFGGSENPYDIRCFKENLKIKCEVVSASSGLKKVALINNDGDKLSYDTEDGTLYLLVQSVEKLLSNIKKYGGFIRDFSIIGNIIQPITEWISRSPDVYLRYFGAINHNGRIIACATSGTGNRIATSDDGGLSWTQRNSAGDYNWRRLATNGTIIVCIATGGQIQTSTDGGETWTLQSPPREAGLNDICYTGAYFIAVSGNQSYSEQVYRTADGVNWSLVDNGDIEIWYCCASDGAGRVVMMATGGEAQYSSDHGFTWQTVASDTHSWQSVTHDGDQFLAVADGGYTMKGNGLSLSTGPQLTLLYPEHIYHAHGQTVVCASDKSGSDVAITLDGGDTWNYMDTPTDAYWNCLSSNDERFVCVGNEGVMTSEL